jgi:hypothetical protein
MEDLKIHRGIKRLLEEAGMTQTQLARALVDDVVKVVINEFALNGHRAHILSVRVGGLE